MSELEPEVEPEAEETEADETEAAGEGAAYNPTVKTEEN